MPSHIGYAALGATTALAPLAFDLRPLTAEDVRIRIAYCGVCHSDIHQARDEWHDTNPTTFPCMPGHEIVGEVTEVGSAVTRFAIGDRVGVGCMVYWGAEDQRGVEEEQYQTPPPVFTYNGVDPHTGGTTFGGYSDEMVVQEHFVLSIPEGMPLAQAAPILCAGVTVWSPMTRWGVGPGMKVGIAGIGGLGHIAVKLAKARGAHVVALTGSEDKRAAALALGADEVVVMSDEDAVEASAASLQVVLSTIPTAFDLNPYLSLLAHDGVLHTVGTLEPVNAGDIDFSVVSMQRIVLSGSTIGTVAETQEVLDFCAANDVLPEVQVISADRINDAFDEVVAGDVRFRYVIDSSTLPAAG